MLHGKLTVSGYIRLMKGTIMSSSLRQDYSVSIKKIFSYIHIKGASFIQIGLGLIRVHLNPSILIRDRINTRE